jgi:hypothetical protein
MMLNMGWKGSGYGNLSFLFLSHPFSLFSSLLYCLFIVSNSSNERINRQTLLALSLSLPLSFSPICWIGLGSKGQGITKPLTMIKTQSGTGIINVESTYTHTHTLNTLNTHTHSYFLSLPLDFLCYWIFISCFLSIFFALFLCGIFIRVHMYFNHIILMILTINFEWWNCVNRTHKTNWKEHSNCIEGLSLTLCSYLCWTIWRNKRANLKRKHFKK